MNVEHINKNEYYVHIERYYKPDESKIRKIKVIIDTKYIKLTEYYYSQEHKTEWIINPKCGFGTMRVDVRQYDIHFQPFIRFTTNNWETFQDITNIHSYTSICRGNYYRDFIDIPLFHTCVVKYALFFVINNQNIWDNNEGNNYEISCDLKKDRENGTVFTKLIIEPSPS
jgi:hypothetical protein